MTICGKCGIAMISKEKKRGYKTYVYYECSKCGHKTRAYEKEKLLRAG